jgi:hypothetical protein
MRAAGVEAVPIHVIGLRGTRLQEIDSSEIEVAVVAGLGGGLDPRLRVGDLVLDTPIAGLPQELPWHVGPVYSADSLVTTPAQKALIFRQTAALAVDMEQSGVRRAMPRGTRVIGIRAISDPAHLAIDPAVLTFLDPAGRPRPLTVAATLMKRPGLIPHLRELRGNTALALHNLGAGVAALVQCLERDGG